MVDTEFRGVEVGRFVVVGFIPRLVTGVIVVAVVVIARVVVIAVVVVSRVVVVARVVVVSRVVAAASAASATSAAPELLFDWPQAIEFQFRITV